MSARPSYLKGAGRAQKYDGTTAYLIFCSVGGRAAGRPTGMWSIASRGVRCKPELG